jgi:hypothetical protein
MTLKFGVRFFSTFIVRTNSGCATTPPQGKQAITPPTSPGLSLAAPPRIFGEQQGELVATMVDAKKGQQEFAALVERQQALRGNGHLRTKPLRRRKSKESERRRVHGIGHDGIEHDGEDLRNLPFLPGSLRWRCCCATLRRLSCLTNTLPRTGLPFSPMRASLGPRALCPGGWTAPIDPAPAACGSRSSIPPASPCRGGAARFGIAEREADRAYSVAHGRRRGARHHAGERLSTHARPQVPDCKYANGSNHNQEHCCIRPRDVKHRKALPCFRPPRLGTLIEY